MAVDRVRSGGVSEREGVGVLTQRRCGIRVTEARLGLQNLASFNEKRCDVVTETVL